MKPKTLKKVYIDLLVMVIGFAVLAYLFKFPWLYIISAIVATSAIHPFTARVISTSWEYIGKTLGKINSSILLSIFFVFVLTPFALLYRLTKGKKKNTLGWQNIENESVDFTKPY